MHTPCDFGALVSGRVGCFTHALDRGRDEFSKGPDISARPRTQMIRLENIGKQNGKQIVFIEASAGLQRGEKIGLVGPNGAGKTTLFRMITGEEQPDEGQVAVDRGITIGYFSQDVGDMDGRPAVAEVMEGAGPVGVLMSEMAER